MNTQSVYCTNEDQIERKVEVAMNSLDRALMAGNLTQQQYNDAVAVVSRWADGQYAYLKARS